MTRRRLRVESNESIDESFSSPKDIMDSQNNFTKDSSLHDSWSNHSSDSLHRRNVELNSPTTTEVTINPDQTHRPVSEFMVDDRYYGRVQRDIKNKGKKDTSCLSCCASFSVVGVLFMVSLLFFKFRFF